VETESEEALGQKKNLRESFLPRPLPPIFNASKQTVEEITIG
jgi:hypothetical protein